MELEQTIERSDFQTDPVATISAAHAVHDTYQAFLPPLLPVLIERLSLSNTQAGLLAVFLQAPSVLQPYLGYLADLYNLRLALSLAPAITAIVMSMVGVTSSYALIVLLVLVAGISSATLHSVAPVISGRLSGSKLGLGMSFWMVGGEIGRTLGPVVIVYSLKYLTGARLPWIMIAGIVASLVIYFKVRDVPVHINASGISLDWRAALRAMGPLMGILALLHLARALLWVAIGTYLPTYLIGEGSSLQFAGASLSIMEFSGVLGALIGGSLSDKLGRRLMLFLSYLATPLMMLLFIALPVSAKPPVLIVLGFTVLSMPPVLMAIVQENCQENRSLANGVYMLISFGASMIATLIIGLISDAWGMHLAFVISAIVMLVGIPLVFLVPKKKAVA